MRTNTWEVVDEMYAEQIEEWDVLVNNFLIYDNAPYKQVMFNNRFWLADKIQLSYRKSSLSADLSAIANGERPCFLCRYARPKEQKAVEWKDYEILANPYPASNLHLTIVCKEHTPQHLGARIKDMVELARMMSEYAIFYNGPKCGASAPDHMHFQAVSIGEASNFDVLRKYLIEGPQVGKNRIYFPLPNITAFGYIVLEVKTYADILPMYDMVRNLLPHNIQEDEPMMNVVAFRVPGATRVVIIPRKNHRPKCYGTDAGQMLVSPASMEMMGKFITSRKEDFERLDEATMQSIYDDVAYSVDEVMEFVKSLQS